MSTPPSHPTPPLSPVVMDGGAGLEEDLVKMLGDSCPIPVTYAGGARCLADLDLVKRLGRGRVDLTIGRSASAPSFLPSLFQRIVLFLWFLCTKFATLCSICLSLPCTVHALQCTLRAPHFFVLYTILSARCTPHVLR